MPKARSEAIRVQPVSVRGAYIDVALHKENDRVWVARGGYLGETIEAKGSSELSALSRWQALARSRRRSE